MISHERLLIYMENVDEDILDRFYHCGFIYDYNKKCFINKESLEHNEKLSIISEVEENGYQYELSSDYDSNCSTNAVGGFGIAPLLDDKYSIIIFRADIEESPISFIFNLKPVNSQEYEVNVIDLKKRMYFKDEIKIYQETEIFKQVIMHYKRNKMEIKAQGFDNSAAFYVFDTIIDQLSYPII